MYIGPLLWSPTACCCAQVLVQARPLLHPAPSLCHLQCCAPIFQLLFCCVYHVSLAFSSARLSNLKGLSDLSALHHPNLLSYLPPYYQLDGFPQASIESTWSCQEISAAEGPSITPPHLNLLEAQFPPPPRRHPKFPASYFAAPLLVLLFWPRSCPSASHLTVAPNGYRRRWCAWGPRSSQHPGRQCHPRNTAKEASPRD